MDWAADGGYGGGFGGGLVLISVGPRIMWQIGRRILSKLYGTHFVNNIFDIL